MQAVAYRENIVPIRAKSIFLLQKLELRKSDSNRSKKVFLRSGSLLIFVVSRPKVFTADSASGLRLEVYGLGFTAWGLRLEVYGQKSTRRSRTPSYGQIGVLQPYDLPVTKGVG